MKLHRTTFSPDEIDSIERLIVKKLSASTEEQKGIRDDIRTIGFYWSDFHPKGEFPKIPYTVENFRRLIADGAITVTGNRKIFIAKEVPTANMMPLSLGKTTQERQNIKKGLPPCVGENPKVLILGTMPGDRSLKEQRYYCNPNNAFWRIMFTLFPKSSEQGMSNEEFIKSKGIALWDCISCGERAGSLDSGFNEATLIGNNIQSFLDEHPSIGWIILNGKTTTQRYFNQFCHVTSSIKVKALCSTASYSSFEEKLNEWRVIGQILNGE